LETVACLGACGIAPVMVINDTVHPQMTPEAAEAILSTLATRGTDTLLDAAASPAPATPAAGNAGGTTR
jgi:hypothetical protein